MRTESIPHEEGENGGEEEAPPLPLPGNKKTEDNEDVETEDEDVETEEEGAKTEDRRVRGRS